jgi:hypothetical protein
VDFLYQLWFFYCFQMHLNLFGVFFAASYFVPCLCFSFRDLSNRCCLVVILEPLNSRLFLVENWCHRRLKYMNSTTIKKENYFLNNLK